MLSKKVWNVPKDSSFPDQASGRLLNLMTPLFIILSQVIFNVNRLELISPSNLALDTLVDQLFHLVVKEKSAGVPN